MSNINTTPFTDEFIEKARTSPLIHAIVSMHKHDVSPYTIIESLVRQVEELQQKPEPYQFNKKRYGQLIETKTP